jgi:REP element-mobilizing transposase RayT
VIISNHIHLIACAQEGLSLSGITRDCKKFTSKAITESIHSEPESRSSWLSALLQAHGMLNPNNKFNQVWQQESHAIELSDLRLFYQKLAYIHMNPVKAGIVLEPEHYLYSSARNYAG